jgi:ABC-2 type transport system permease protein
MSETATMGLHPLPERGWRAGLSPLMRAEFGAWWRTREWWTQALLWTVVINGSVAVAVWGDAPEGLGVFGLYGVMTMFAAIAVAILMQETIVGEKRSGTAAWVLSKPASRESFLLSKLVPNAVGVIATMIAIPSAVLLVQTLLAGIEVSAPRFALGTLVPALNLLFYLTLTLMLGTLFDSAGPVIAIPLAFAFGQQLIAAIPGLGSVLPWALVVGAGDSETSVTGAVITGQPIPAPAALVTTSLACIVFVAVAFWKWRRTEL